MKKEFEIKDFGKTKICLGLQIENLEGEIFVHQVVYTPKVLKRFSIDKVHLLSTLMVVRFFYLDKNSFRPKEEDKEILGLEVPYFSAMGALMYLANCTRSDISFTTNLLARFTSSPIRRH